MKLKFTPLFSMVSINIFTFSDTYFFHQKLEKNVFFKTIVFVFLYPAGDVAVYELIRASETGAV